MYIVLHRQLRLIEMFIFYTTLCVIKGGANYEMLHMLFEILIYSYLLLLETYYSYLETDRNMLALVTSKD